MKVKELIEALEKMDSEKRVVIHGYEGGYADIEGIEEIKLKLNVNIEWFFGPHESVIGEDEVFDEEAVLI